MTTPSDVVPTGSVAKKRWNILRRAVVDAAAETEPISNDDVSVRRFSSFDLFRIRRVPDPDLHKSVDDPSAAPLVKRRLLTDGEYIKDDRVNGVDERWFHYDLADFDHAPIKISLPTSSQKPNLHDLANFGEVDNTGNVCVWPAEEVLAFYLARHPEIVQDKVTLELGGGMTCLAGLVAAKWAGARRVVLTDGNAKAVENVERILKVNGLTDNTNDANNDATNLSKQTTEHIKLTTDLSKRTTDNQSSVSNALARLLRWDAVQVNASDLQRSVDVIFAADCLFFDAFRQSLVDALDYLLIADSLAAEIPTALIMAPRRKNTLTDFVDLAEKKGFVVKVRDRYDDFVDARLVEVKKKDASFDVDIQGFSRSN